MRCFALKISALFDLFARSYLVLTFSLIIFLFFAISLSAAFETSTKDGTDFIWQTIGFTFVLAALTLSINSREKITHSSTEFERVGYLFILSGTTLIFGNGLTILGVLEKAMFVGQVFKKIGAGLFTISIFLLSLAITLMTYQAIRKLFSTH